MPGVGLPAIPANFGAPYAAGRASAGGGANPGIGALMSFAPSTTSTSSSAGGSPLAGLNALSAKYGAHPKSGGGGSFWGDLKAPFWTAMKVVNTPFDAIETGLGDAAIAVHNVGAAIGGNKQSSYLPTHDFYASFHGSSPGSDFLGRLGVGPGALRTYGGLALDVGTAVGTSFLDPLGLVGLPAKAADAAGHIAAIGGRAGDAARVVGESGFAGRAAETGFKGLGDIGKTARTAEKVAGNPFTKFEPAARAAAKVSDYTSTFTKGARVADKGANLAKMGKLALAKGITEAPSAGITLDRATNIAKIGRAFSGSSQNLSRIVPGILGKAARAGRDLTGPRAMARAFKVGEEAAPAAEPAQRAASIGERLAASPEINRSLVRNALDNPAVSRGVFDGASPSAWNAIGDTVRIDPGRAANIVDAVMGGDAGIHGNVGQLLHEAMAAEAAAKEMPNFGVRFGPRWAAKIGDAERFAPIVKGNWAKPAMFVKSMKFGKKGLGALDSMFRVHASQMLATSARMKAKNFEEQIAHMADYLNNAKVFDITPQESMLLATKMHAGRITLDFGNDLKLWMEHQGLWTDKMTQLDEGMQKLFNEFSKSAGWHTVDEVLAHLDQQIKGYTDLHPEALNVGADGLPAMYDGAAHPELAKLIAAKENLASLGPYAPTLMHDDVLKALKELYKKQGFSGQSRIDALKLVNADPRMSRKEASALGWMTKEQFATDAKTAAAGRAPSEGVQMTDAHIQEMTRKIAEDAGRNVFRDTAVQLVGADGKQIAGIEFRPAIDAIAMFKGRAQAEVRIALDHEISVIVDKAVAANPELALTGTAKAELKARLGSESYVGGKPGTLSSHSAFAKLQKATMYIKWMMTTVNPSHYIKVATQDWMNTWVTGNWRHIASGPVMPWTKVAGLDKLDKFASPEELGKMIDLGNGRMVTQLEAQYVSHLIGLGFMHGYVGEEIGHVGQELGFGMKGITEDTSNPLTMYARAMKRANINRDNAQRMRTFLNHWKAGDTPLEAAAKTIRVNFDYGAMTDVEKNMIRHLVLFYSWYKKNTELHVWGIAHRPALYAAVNTVERDRPKQLNEPGYYATSGLLPLGGLGQYGFGNPVADAANNLNLDPWTGGRQWLSRLTPLALVPAEIAANTNVAKGIPLQNTPGLNQPSVFGKILQELGVPQGTGWTMSSRFTHGPASPATDPRFNLLADLFQPPGEPGFYTGFQGGESTSSLLGRLTGIRPHTVDQRAALAQLHNKNWAAMSQSKSLRRHGQLP